IVVLATHWHGVLVLLALVVLLAVFGLAARYALGRTAQVAARAAPAAGVPVGAAHSAALIINLQSGGGKAERLDLAAEARRRGVEAIIFPPRGDLLELAGSAIAHSPPVIRIA